MKLLKMKNLLTAGALLLATVVSVFATQSASTQEDNKVASLLEELAQKDYGIYSLTNGTGGVYGKDNKFEVGFRFNAVAFEFEIPAVSLVDPQPLLVGVGYWSSDSASFVKMSVCEIPLSSTEPTKSAVTLELDGEATWSAGDKVVIGAGIYATQTHVSPTMKLVNTPSVPEPSAFGMLAGVGALVLVAARRRRK